MILVSVMNKICIKLILWYQKKTENSKKRCKYYPSCSNYGLECYRRFNFFKASWLTFYRLIRCNPWSRGGYNPVPEKKSKLKKVANSTYLLEFRENTDRPNLGYIYKENGSYIIDAGNSKKHVKHFYKKLKKNNLPMPKYSIITHHHWDHCFGLIHTNTHSYGLSKTNEEIIKYDTLIKEIGIKYLIKEKIIPLFSKDHLLLEYKHKLKSIRLSTISKTFDNNLAIDNLLLFRFPSNHTDDTLAILDKEDSILYLGDALCGKIIDFDFISDINILNEQYDLINSLDFKIAIESHQSPKTKEEILEKLQKKINEKN